MPKKSSPRKKSASSKANSSKSRPTPKIRRALPSATFDDAYADYLERYELFGEGRPRLSLSEFNRLDDELLDLLAAAEDSILNDEQVVRLHELEFLLLDDQSDSAF